MRCIVAYIHPVNGCTYLFKDFKMVDGVLKPIGCFRHRRSEATVFETKRDAYKVVDHLKALGCVHYSVRSL